MRSKLKERFVQVSVAAPMRGIEGRQIWRARSRLREASHGCGPLKLRIHVAAGRVAQTVPGRVHDQGLVRRFAPPVTRDRVVDDNVPRNVTEVELLVAFEPYEQAAKLASDRVE